MYAHVKEVKTVKQEDVLNEISSTDGIVYALYTNKLTCGDNVTDIQHLMEVRIFNENGEKKLSRYSLEEDFICRVADDEYFRQKLENENDSLENRTLEDIQYLDRDKTMSRVRNYRSTGGGEYTLPDEGYNKIHIRNYIDYDDNGIAYISDFRIVELLKEGESVG